MKTTIDAMKQAIAALITGNPSQSELAAYALRKAIQQEEAQTVEPVAWQHKDGNDIWVSNGPSGSCNPVPLFTHPAPAPCEQQTLYEGTMSLALEALQKERQAASGKRDFSLLSVHAIEALELVLLNPVSFAVGKVQWALVQNLCACCSKMNHSMTKMDGFSVVNLACPNLG